MTLSTIEGDLLRRPVQAVQTPSLILPRVAGEETGEGLNGAQRLNGLNCLNS